MPNVIKFYYPNEPYGEFSNFYIRPIMVDTVQWPTTEHFFQAAKSEDPQIQEYVRTQLKTPGKAKNYCTQQVQLRANWEYSVQGLSPVAIERLSDASGIVVEKVKDHIMFQALGHKFRQHEDLGKILLDTGDAILVEDTQKVGSDPYWGNGPSGNGLNKLGRMLMLVRISLRRLDPVVQ